MKIIGIAGGSGSGKSTVSVALCIQYPDDIALLHVDDYFKKREDAPRLGEFTNWDHPDSLDLERLYKDILTLREGRAITISTKSELYNPGYHHTLKNKKEYLLEPKSILIVEGYLALHDSKIRNLMDQKIYLDIPIEESARRRSANKFPMRDEYFNAVLAPMHKQYVEPTKEFADIVIDVLKNSQQVVFKRIESAVLHNQKQ